MNDDHPDDAPRPTPASSAQFLPDLLMGLGFYSRLPLFGRAPEVPELNRMAPALPFVSLLMGLPSALLLVVLVLVGMPGIYAAGLATVLLIFVSGAMAEDALADAADGVFGGTTPTRRLEIMRDTRHGTYGVIALVLMLLLRVIAVGAMVPGHTIGAAGAWLAAMVLARSGSLWLCVALPPARPDGLSAAVGGVTRTSFVIGLALASIIGIVLAFSVAGPFGLIVTALLLPAIALGWTLTCRRLVGGQTGDLIGALQTLLELGALSVFLAFA